LYHIHDTAADLQVQFNKAMELVGKTFLDRVLYFKNSWLPAREVVEEAISNRNKVSSMYSRLYNSLSQTIVMF